MCSVVVERALDVVGPVFEGLSDEGSEWLLMVDVVGPESGGTVEWVVGQPLLAVVVGVVVVVPVPDGRVDGFVD